MKHILLTILMMLSFSAFSQQRQAVMVGTNAVLLAPTNLFAANSNLLNQAVTRGTAGLSNATDFLLSSQTNWTVASVTNAGSAAYSNSTAFYLNSNPSNYVSEAKTNLTWVGTNAFTNMDNLFVGTLSNSTVKAGTITNATITNAANISGNIARLTNGTITGSTITNASITNAAVIGGNVGVLSNGVYQSPVFTNAVNYGDAFRSPGSGGDSEQIGSGAAATGASSTAIGKDSVSSAPGSSAFGNTAVASGYQSTAIGFGSLANKDNANAFGSSAGAIHTNSTAIGVSSLTTRTNQIRLGASTDLVSIPGSLQVDGNITNIHAMGTNIFPAGSDISFGRYANSSLANSNNAAVLVGTNVFVQVSGPTADFNIAGIADGRNGKLVILMNRTGYTMTLYDKSGIDPLDANRIETGKNANVSYTNNPGIVTLIYDSVQTHWVVVSDNQ